jgi:superfamily II DNA helicase RecQ|tara:strand:- start:155 stop:541 length:387 start_codon:yes stop_codon:yes gene_type:complete
MDFTKICAGSQHPEGEQVSITAFGRDRSRGDMRHTKCRECRRLDAEADLPEGYWDGVDRDHFTQLLAFRTQLAHARNVPPYVILHNRTLRDLARSHPTTLDALRDCHGIGDHKRDTLGPDILQFLATI